MAKKSEPMPSTSLQSSSDGDWIGARSWIQSRTSKIQKQLALMGTSSTEEQSNRSSDDDVLSDEPDFVEIRKKKPIDKEDSSSDYSASSDELIYDPYDVLIKEPVCKQLFDEYCRETSYCKTLYKFVNDMKNLNFEKVANQKEFRIRLHQLYLDPIPDLRAELRFTKRWMHKANKIKDQKITSKIAKQFCTKIESYFRSMIFKQFRLSTLYDQFVRIKYIECRTANAEWFAKRYRLISGEYWDVGVCEWKLLKVTLALKEIAKSRIKNRKMELAVLNEKKILDAISSRFVLNLICTFQTPDSICMVTNLMIGGNLKYYIEVENRRQGFGTDRAQFYAAEIISGLVYLHSLDIAHFDLKPGNILMDARGHIRISGFRYAKKLQQPLRIKYEQHQIRYLAPEILLEKKVSFAADWFSFGCIFFEMIEGENPFDVLKTMYPAKRTIDLIVFEREQYSMKFTRDAYRLCRRLLKKDPVVRLNKKIGGITAAKLKEHSFFREIDWNAVENGLVKAPFVPELLREEPRKFRITIQQHRNPSFSQTSFYRKLCTGAHSINWQKMIIERGFLHEVFPTLN